MGKGTTTIALAYQGWAFNNNSEDEDNSPYCPCHTRSSHRLCHTASLFLTISSSTFVMWFLLCATSLCFMALSVVAVEQHPLSPMPTFPSSPGYYILVFPTYSLVIHKTILFWSTYYSSLDRLEILRRHSGSEHASGAKLNAPLLICC